MSQFYLPRVESEFVRAQKPGWLLALVRSAMGASSSDPVRPIDGGYPCRLCGRPLAVRGASVCKYCGSHQ